MQKMRQEKKTLNEVKANGLQLILNIFSSPEHGIQQKQENLGKSLGIVSPPHFVCDFKEDVSHIIFY